MSSTVDYYFTPQSPWTSNSNTFRSPAMKIGGAIFSAVWMRERHIADGTVLAELLAECGLRAERLEQSRSQDRLDFVDRKLKAGS